MPYAVAAPAAAGTPVVLVVGDSLSAEYGLKRGTGWVALLEKRLAQEKVAAKVVNASISGDMQVPPNYGSDYGNRFAGLFAKVAKEHQAGLVPFLLEGVADGPDATRLFQADRIHPREEAHPRMLENVWPELKKMLR